VTHIYIYIYIYIYITPYDCYYQSIQSSIIPNTQQRQQGHGLAPLVRPKWCLLLVTAVLGYGLLAQCASVAWVGAPCRCEAREQSGDKDGGSWSPQTHATSPARQPSSMLASTVTARVSGPNRGRTGIMEKQRKRGSSVWPKSRGPYVGRRRLCHVTLYTCHQNSRESGKQDWQND
jgi:hypothetical protein